MQKYRKYIDLDLVKQVPNKHHLTPKNIKKLVIVDWDRLKKHTWYNQAMQRTGDWWCHLEGSNPPERRYEDDSEFWIGFNEKNNKIDCHFSCYEGMCHYQFNEFYTCKEIENKYDMQMQMNTLRWLNQMLDDGILAIPVC